ncbi:CACTA transposable element [Tanacetum coccineum]|uniref:CACTA transposable element n=1 Tax=Tanacetum coccineum TaxID=301880 RepID=A0ABQ4ZZC7_9ASTR
MISLRQFDGLAADGFNPFGMRCQNYSMWPPLIKELQELWKGVWTKDAATNTLFQMKAAVLWTINDFPARSSLSGWSGQGYYACPTCNEDTPSMAVKSKIVYVGHRRFLRTKHPLRSKFKEFYDGVCSPRSHLVGDAGGTSTHGRLQWPVPAQCQSCVLEREMRLKEGFSFSEELFSTSRNGTINQDKVPVVGSNVYYGGGRVGYGLELNRLRKGHLRRTCIEDSGGWCTQLDMKAMQDRNIKDGFIPFQNVQERNLGLEVVRGTIRAYGEVMNRYQDDSDIEATKSREKVCTGKQAEEVAE